MTDTKLKLGTKIGYSVGSMTRIGEEAFYFYFILFLTTVVGIEPAIAGTIAFIAILWDAITDPVIGYFSDRSRSKYGKRRPFMLAAAVPMALGFWLLFVKFDFGATGNIIFYTIVGILFWTSYTAFIIPHGALGAELTSDYTERANLRAFCTAGAYVAVMVGGAGLILIKGYLNETLKYSQAFSWNIAAGVMAALVLSLSIIAWRVTRGKENVDVEIEKDVNILKTYKEIFKLKPFRSLTFFIAVFCVALSLVQSAVIYAAIYVLGADESVISTLIMVSCATVLGTVVFADKLIQKFGKKNPMIISFLLYIVALFILNFRGIHSLTDLYILAVVFNIANTFILCGAYSMPYDLGELSEFQTGKSRSITIFALFSLSLKVGSSIGQWLLGALLQLSGFDGSKMEQTDEVIQWIVNITTIVPALLCLLAVLGMLTYKLDKDTHGALLKALSLKKEGKEYSTEGFQAIL